MKTMQVSLDLSSLWLYYITKEKTENIFKVGYNDPDGKWAQDDEVKVGLRLKVGKPEFFAYNITQKRELDVDPVEIDVGKGFRKCFLPHRLLRANMPQRRPLGRQVEPSTDIAMCNYYCQNPYHRYSLLVREPFCVMTLHTGRIWALYYNFAPIAKEGHFLCMPARFSGTALVLPHFSQVMTRDLLEDVFILYRESQGFLYFFNSIHAGATQHHFHYQLIYVGDELLAVEKASVLDVCGHSFLDCYSIEGLVFELPKVTVDEVWSCIDSFQQGKVPFNLIMLRNKIYLIPRNIENEIVGEFPFGVLASLELAGRLILSDRKNFEKTTEGEVKMAFEKSGLKRNEILRLIQSGTKATP